MSVHTYQWRTEKGWFTHTSGEQKRVGSHIPLENRKGLVHTYHWRTEKGWFTHTTGEQKRVGSHIPLENRKGLAHDVTLHLFHACRPGS